MDAGSPPSAAGNDLDPQPAPPRRLQLADRRRAEGVARRQHHRIVLFLKQVRQLGDGRGLA